MNSPPPYQHRQPTLHTLLLGSIGLSSVAILIFLLRFLSHRDTETTTNLYAGTLLLLLFSTFYVGARRGLNTLVTHCFCSMYFFLGTYMMLKWGIQLPEALLVFVLASVTSGLVISTLAGVIYTFATCIAIAVVANVHMHQILSPDLSWSRQQGSISDIIAFSVTLSVITITTCLSNKEIGRSFAIAKQAEIELQQDRDQLETTIALRTAELHLRQQAEIDHLYHFAYFGRASSTFLHDIVSPIFAVALILKRMESPHSSDLLRRAIRNIERVEQYIKEAQRNYRVLPTTCNFNLFKESSDVFDALQERIVQENVTVSCTISRKFHLDGDPLKFQRALINFVTNALDACLTVVGSQACIVISATKEGKCLILCIQDNGPGIPPANLGQVFDPFFSTKHQLSRMGIGLAICKEIIEQDFRGSITVRSTVGEGTEIRCTLPC